MVRFEGFACYLSIGSREVILLVSQLFFREPKMTARSIRRAQERKAKKLTRKAEMARVGQLVNLPADCQSALTSEPVSRPGKAKSSLNAVKTGLTGRTVLLPADDAAEYERHIAAYFQEFQPVGQRECDLVQSIAETQWRLLRIPSLEAGIYALGHLEFANAFDDHDPALRPGMIEVRTYIAYERQLRNLHLQESRLQRRREKEIAELREVQSERQRKETERLENLGQALSPGVSQVHRPVENGFEFSNACAKLPNSPALSSEPVSSPTAQAQLIAA